MLNEPRRVRGPIISDSVTIAPAVIEPPPGSSEASLGARLLGVIRIERGKIIQVLLDDSVALARPLL
jgi:hypothetical protein